MEQQITNNNISLSAVERAAIIGDLAKLSPAERVSYYRSVCYSLGLNPLTKPFNYIILNGRMTLYATKDATDQLRQKRNISITIVSRERLDDLYIVTARATAPDGRQDESVGAVNVKGLSGEALANAIMKAETKAKRRVTLSICGLGWTDESEIDSIPNAATVAIDMDTDEPQDEPQPQCTLPAGKASNEPHWSEDINTRKAFWAWTSSMSLTNTEVHQALGVEHLNEFNGSEKEAKDMVLAYIKTRLAEDNN